MQIELTKYNIFLGKGRFPLATPKIVYMYKFWQKRDWNCAVPLNTHSLMKRRAAPF